MSKYVFYIEIDNSEKKARGIIVNFLCKNCGIDDTIFRYL